MSNEVKITGEPPARPARVRSLAAFSRGDRRVEHLAAVALRRAVSMPSELIIGVTGGIAAFKTAALVELVGAAGARRLRRDDPRGPQVRRPGHVSRAHRPAGRQRLFDRDHFPLGAHIELAEKADLMFVAPASADFLAKAACGLADDLLSTLLLSFDGPLAVAPAMNTAMWAEARRPAQHRHAPRRRRPLRRPARRLAKLPPHRHGPHGRAGRYPSRD